MWTPRDDLPSAAHRMPLHGLRVLELARILAGPWAGQILADLVAEVIKVERPGSGDDTRAWGPPFVEAADGGHLDAAYFHSCNRGKRSIAIDFEDRLLGFGAKSVRTVGSGGSSGPSPGCRSATSSSIWRRFLPAAAAIHAASVAGVATRVSSRTAENASAPAASA